tara:strand:- start:506 stop:2182 length:1677 start_codon:yes stop_codon:yes gene_type:complete
MKKIIAILLISNLIFSQELDLNRSEIYDQIRFLQINNSYDEEISFNIRPFEINNKKIENNFINQYLENFRINFSSKNYIEILPINYDIEFNSNLPYNRNNSSMIPNKGFQHLTSLGFLLKLGFLEIKLKPEHHYSQNLAFDGFWEGHYPVIWARRYNLWNHIDIPERFGKIRHNKTGLGQSYLKLKYKNLSLGISNENLWWGPSYRNSILMSNHSSPFKHISFNTTKPIKSFLGNFEWMLVTGRLEPSKYTPPNSDISYAGSNLYVPKVNQIPEENDWRYFQGLVINYNPKWFKNLHLGIIRVVQLYSAQLEGRYWWMEGKSTYFPVFNNIFRKNDKYVDYETQTDQSGSVFFRWLWNDSKAEIYGEYALNDTRHNLRDFLLDSDHSRGVTFGLKKIFNIKNKNYGFSWEWTQLEQTRGRKLRYTEPWYYHTWVRHGYTNFGEIIGASIGPGSNSHYVSLKTLNNNNNISIGIEMIDQDNDFYYKAFDDANDFRRYWKDFNFNFGYTFFKKNLFFNGNIVYSRSLNYQWQLEENSSTYYQPGEDKNNLHLNLKISYKL